MEGVLLLVCESYSLGVNLMLRLEDGKSYLQKKKEGKMKGKDYEWDRKAEKKDGWDHLK